MRELYLGDNQIADVGAEAAPHAHSDARGLVVSRVDTFESFDFTPWPSSSNPKRSRV